MTRTEREEPSAHLSYTEFSHDFHCHNLSHIRPEYIDYRSCAFCRRNSVQNVPCRVIILRYTSCCARAGSMWLPPSTESWNVTASYTPAFRCCVTDTLHSRVRHIPTRNSSGDEIANVNFLTDDIVHALQNTIDSYINSATDLRSCVGTQVYQSQWNNAMQRPLRRSRSFKVTDFGTNRKLIIRLPITD